jgi:hypothetical protein
MKEHTPEVMKKWGKKVVSKEDVILLTGLCQAPTKVVDKRPESESKAGNAVDDQPKSCG